MTAFQLIGQVKGEQMDIKAEQDLDAVLRLQKLAKRTQLVARAKGRWRSKAWLGLELAGLALLFFWWQEDSARQGSRTFFPLFPILIFAVTGLQSYFNTRIDALISLLEEEGLLSTTVPGQKPGSG